MSAFVCIFLSLWKENRGVDAVQQSVRVAFDYSNPLLQERRKESRFCDSLFFIGRSVGIRTRGLLDPNRRTMRYDGLRQQPRIRITQDGKRLDSTNFLMFLTQILYHKSVPNLCAFSRLVRLVCVKEKGADLRPLHS